MVSVFDGVGIVRTEHPGVNRGKREIAGF